MTFSDLMETAASWHSGQTSALYSLLSTEMVHSITHKCDLCNDLVDEIQGDGIDEPTLADEKKSLIALALFVSTAPLNESLSKCTVDDKGRFLFLYKEMPAPKGWSHA